jgi:hypothetical protein
METTETSDANNDYNQFYNNYLSAQAKHAQETRKEVTRRRGEIIAWCDARAAEGELKFRWDGGHDSGWAWLEHNGEELGDGYGSISDLLVRRWEGLLDYGSWAMDGTASGEAVYDPETKTFSGEDDYHSEETLDHELSEWLAEALVLRVPADLPFERLELGGEDLDGLELDCVLRNGYITPAQQEALDRLERQLSAAYRELADAVNNSEGEVSESQWVELTLPRGDFSEEADAEGMRSMTLTSLPLRVYATQTSLLELDLLELDLEEEEEEG